MQRLINGSHYTDYGDYYEWWYFHFLSEDGFAANIVLHETDIFGFLREPYVSMSFRLPNGATRCRRIILEKEDIERDIRYLSVVDNLFYETEDSISINIHFPENTHFKAVIKKTSSPEVMNNGLLYRARDSKKSSHWVPFVPRGTYEGILTLENSDYRLQGFAYQDHQWGNFPVQNFARDWIWGNFCEPKLSFTFFIIFTQNEKIINRQVLLSDSKIIISSVDIKNNPCYLIDTSQNVLDLELVSKTKIPQIVLDWDKNIYFLLNPSNILRSRMDEKYPGFTATYLRWVSCGIYSELPNTPLHGITEYLRIRKGGEHER